MKIGPLVIARAQTAEKPKERAPLGEIGAPGTQIFGGRVLQEDYNPDLQRPACYDVYDRMRLSDGQVAAALAVIKLPILRAHWQVEPASDSAQDREIAEFCESDLRSMTTSFNSTLRQILLHLDYGCYTFEKVWEYREDGKVHLRKLAPRSPRSLLEIQVDEFGGFAGVKQGTITASGYSVREIAGNKLAHFVNAQEGANFWGHSILRPAYKHWYYKDGHYRIDAIANERRGVGVDIGTIKAGAADKGNIKAQLERALMTLHAHEKQYFVEDEENYTYRVDAGGARGATNAIMATIEHHDLRILRAVIAEFVAMGAGSTGSLAMHKDKTGFFLMALEATSDNIADTATDHILRPLVTYNWAVRDYPRLKYSRLDTRNVGEIAESVTKLVSVGALTPGADTERELRVLLDVPEEKKPYKEPEIAPAEPKNASEEDEIRAIQARQVAAVRELLAAGVAPADIRLRYKEELIAAIAKAGV